MTWQSTGDEKAAILIVDDKVNNLVAMERVLESLDVEMVRASSGRQALSQLLRRDFAVVLLDVQMPEMDGFETASLMKNNKKTSSVPIIFVTAINKEERYVFQGYQSGAVDYLFKPLEPEIVRGKVRVFLDLYRQRYELQRAYAALEERNQELQDFASVVAHDLVSPLDKVVAFAARLRQSLPPGSSEKPVMYLDAITRSVRQMTAFVESLLEYARVGSPEESLEPVDLASVLQQAIENLDAAIQPGGARVEVGEMPVVLGDRLMLVQLFQNLIANAVKFRGSDPPLVKITAEPIAANWRIAVADNGIGIAAENQAKVFAAFTRLHSRNEYDGSGIGLATCKKVVDRHRGKIWVESEPGKGSTFYVDLPMPEAPVALPITQLRNEPSFQTNPN